MGKYDHLPWDAKRQAREKASTGVAHFVLFAMIISAGIAVLGGFGWMIFGWESWDPATWGVVHGAAIGIGSSAVLLGYLEYQREVKLRAEELRERREREAEEPDG